MFRKISVDCYFESLAVVADIDAQRVVNRDDMYLHAICFSMLQDIGNRFLRYTERHDPDLRVNNLVIALNAHFQINIGILEQSRRVLLDRSAQSQVVQKGWPETERQAPDRVDRRIGEAGQFAELLGGS